MLVTPPADESGEAGAVVDAVADALRRPAARGLPRPTSPAAEVDRHADAARLAPRARGVAEAS